LDLGARQRPLLILHTDEVCRVGHLPLPCLLGSQLPLIVFMDPAMEVRSRFSHLCYAMFPIWVSYALLLAAPSSASGTATWGSSLGHAVSQIWQHRRWGQFARSLGCDRVQQVACGTLFLHLSLGYRPLLPALLSSAMG
jgi:hypothetical protein